MPVANGVMHTEQKAETLTEKQPELIATPFGDLTRDEVREWEKMLGRSLLRLPKHSPQN
jgi:hypothetical protein